MKTPSILLYLCLSGISLSAQAQSFVWPIAGKTAGENVIYKPQEYIDDELNFAELVIGGKEGDVVLCPSDGVVQFVGVTYFQSLTKSMVSGATPGLSFDRNIAGIDFGKGTQRKYYTGMISIRLSDGNKIHLQGLAGEKVFKTGQKLAAGDSLGVIGYSYKSIKTPSLMLSISDRKGVATDPMTVFGLKSSFIAGKELTRDNPMSAEKAREDLEVLKNAFCELYPSLQQRLPEQEFRTFVDSLKNSVSSEIDPGFDFRMLIQKVLHKIPDSHKYMYRDPVRSDLRTIWTPGEYLMFCDDTVRVLLAAKGYEQYEGKIVKTINGMPAREYAKRADMFVSNYDGNIESVTKEENVLLGRYLRHLAPYAGQDSVHELVFSDGTGATIPFRQKSMFYSNDSYERIMQWYLTNARLDDNDVFETKKLNDSTSYLAIKTFEMLTEQVERVRDFLDTCETANLIVDVRNNGGGHNEVLMQLLSYFTQSPMDRQKGGYKKVNKTGQFSSLKYSLNYSADMDIFPEYEKREDGYYSLDTLETCSAVMPDGKVHYDGRVYVLTNGHSFSAATLFPAVLVRNRRAVSVGRETGSGYHSMTALKFADIRLPNSLQTIRIPMVQLVFDETVCERLPEGRGLIPDYPLALTYNEIMGGADGKTDVMLEYALSLIENGQYLSEDDPFAQFDGKPAGSSSTKNIIILLSLLLAATTVFVASRRRR